MDALPEPTAPYSLSPEPTLRDLDRRVQSLEQAVVRMEDTHVLEERVLARIAERTPATPAGAEVNAGVIEERVLARLAERVPTASAAPPSSDGAPMEDSAAFWPASWGGRWASWLFVDMFREARLLVHMIFDRRYTMAWTTRLVVMIFLPAVLTAHWWLPIFFFWLPLTWFDGLRGLFINAVNLLLAFALYKALSREVRRYNERIRR